MEVVKLVLIVVLLLSNVLCQEADDDKRREGIEENNCPNCEIIEDILLRMTRRPRTRQSLGRTGKKNFARLQTARKRHKFQTFVGLMGKRSFDDQGAL